MMKVLRPNTMTQEHDHPDPSLIVKGSRRHQPSKRVRGQDYPTTALEALHNQEQGKLTLYCMYCLML